jgi:hypothetical protein
VQRNERKLQIIGNPRGTTLSLPEVSICELSEFYPQWIKKYSAGSFFKTRSKFKMKFTRSKVLVPKERSLHNAYIS